MGSKMNTVLVTGSKGFIGKNLMEFLSRQRDIKIHGIDIGDGLSKLRAALQEADIVYHLAGINRPGKEEDFETGNVGSTKTILSLLEDLHRTPAIALSSSTQAEMNNPYGVSKKKAEDLLFEYGEKTGAAVYVYRLTNVFGKWSRPNYNSVVATFCYNIAHDLDIFISDKTKRIELVYIDDVVDSFLRILKDKPKSAWREYLTVSPTYKISLGELAERLYQFRDIRRSLLIPDLADDFMKCLYATYLSYLDGKDFSYALEVKSDNRGSLIELIKSRHFGQIFVSKTHGRILRGNHYHNTKTEKFCIIQGEAVIRFRHILSDEILLYHVSGNDIRIVDIPPGYTHSIENLSDEEMIVLFWADEIFDPGKPDTYYCEV
ncbi:MAG: polysaccharide biosynthesis C-terminal domain-containing protein [Syntrophales bacterium]